MVPDLIQAEVEYKLPPEVGSGWVVFEITKLQGNPILRRLLSKETGPSLRAENLYPFRSSKNAAVAPRPAEPEAIRPADPPLEPPQPEMPTEAIRGTAKSVVPQV